MGKGILWFGLSCIAFAGCLESLPRYWLLEEDFFKLGKKELFEQEKKTQMKSSSWKALVAEDLENPQYVVFTPLKELASLRSYPPVSGSKAPLLDSCLHFQIFSLYELLEECSLKAMETFSKSHPYYLYLLYEIMPASEASFEEHLKLMAARLKEKPEVNWRTWKVLLGGDVPKYLLCLSFSTKEQLKEVKEEELFEELQIKEILRGKKRGWMKQAQELSTLQEKD
jgi:hypothetical protein